MNFWNTKLAQQIADQLVALSNFWWKKTKAAQPAPTPASTKKTAAPRKPRATKAKKEQ